MIHAGIVLGLLDESRAIGDRSAATKHRELTISWSRYGYQGVIIERDAVDDILSAAEKAGFAYCYIQPYGHVLSEHWQLDGQQPRDFFSALEAWIDANDFLVTGPKAELVEMRRQLRDNYKVDGDILGQGSDEKPDGKFLGRRLAHRHWGIEIESDDRLVIGMVEEFGVGGKGADTPGQKEDIQESETLMDSASAAKFRRGAAELNYLGQALISNIS